MPSAVTAIFDGDSRPMEAEYAKMETVAKRFGKTIADLNAEENAQILRNAAAYKQLVAERNKAAQLVRYNAPSSGVALPGFGPKSAEEFKRGLETMRAMPGVTSEVAQNTGKAAANVERMGHASGGVNQIIRETMVVFRELGRGNFSRIPGSLSLIAQGFATLRGISMATLGGWALAIGGVVGSVFIYLHRVKDLTNALRTSLDSAFNVEHIARYMQKANILAQLEKDVADSARKIREEHDGAQDSLQRQLDMTKDRISSEQQLLEIQKQNELATATTPQQREMIEKKYSKLILDKKKDERDAEVKSMQEEVRKLPAEIAKTKDEITKLTGGDSGYMSQAVEQINLKRLQDASDRYKSYRQQLMPGEKGNGEPTRESDQALVNKVNKQLSDYDAVFKRGDALTLTVATMLLPSEAERAKAKAAQSRLDNARDTENSLNSFVNSADDRTRARARVAELENKVRADEDRLAKLGPHGGGLIEDMVKRNLSKDAQDLALEKARLGRTDSPGHGERGYGLNAQQRLGTYAVTPSDVRTTNDLLRKIADNTHKQPGARPVNTKGSHF